MRLQICFFPITRVVNLQVFYWLLTFFFACNHVSLCHAVICCCKISHFVTIWLMNVWTLWGFRGSLITVTDPHLGKWRGFFGVYSKKTIPSFSQNGPFILKFWSVCVCVSILKCNYQCNIGFITISYLNRKIIYSIFIVQFYLERKTERERAPAPSGTYLPCLRHTYKHTYIHVSTNWVGSSSVETAPLLFGSCSSNLRRRH